MQLTHKTVKRLHEIAQRAGAATPGPFIEGYKDGSGKYDPEERSASITSKSRKNIGTSFNSVVSVHNLTNKNFKNDLDFFVHSRDDIPWLVRLVEELIEGKFNEMAKKELKKKRNKP